MELDRRHSRALPRRCLSHGCTRSCHASRPWRRARGLLLTGRALVTNYSEAPAKQSRQSRQWVVIPAVRSASRDRCIKDVGVSDGPGLRRGAFRGDERRSAFLGGEAKTARAFQPAALQIVQRKARHACMVNRTLPRRLCVNPEWLTAARKDLFPACFAP